METSEGGSEILRHGPRQRGFEPSPGDPALIDAVTAHFDKHIAESKSVLHEVVSDLVHIDVHFIPPGPRHPWHTLFTTGMSERPMTIPAQFKDVPRYAELMMRLDPGWPLPRMFSVLPGDVPEEDYWPIRWLKTLARFPHEYDTGLGLWHTVPNDGDPPQPFADNTRLCCWLLTVPISLPENAWTIEGPGGRSIAIYEIYPIHADEMQLKLDRGTDALIDALAAANASQVIRADRPSVLAPKRKKLFGLF